MKYFLTSLLFCALVAAQPAPPTTPLTRVFLTNSADAGARISIGAAAQTDLTIVSNSIAAIGPLATNAISAISGIGTNTTFIQSATNLPLVNFHLNGASANTDIALENGWWNAINFTVPVLVFRPAATNKSMPLDIISSSWDKDAWLDILAPGSGTRFDGTNGNWAEMIASPLGGYAAFTAVNHGASNKLDVFLGNGVIEAGKTIGVGKYTTSVHPFHSIEFRPLASARFGMYSANSGVALNWCDDTAYTSNTRGNLFASQLYYSYNGVDAPLLSAGVEMQLEDNNRLAFSTSGGTPNLYAFNDSGTTLGIKYQANYNFFRRDTAGTQVTFMQWRPDLDVNLGVDSASGSVNFAAFNDSAAQIPIIYNASGNLFTFNGSGTRRTFAQFRPAAAANYGIDTTNSSISTRAFDASNVLIGEVHQAASQFYDFDGTAAKIISGIEWRVATNVRVSLDANSSVARFASFNDSGTATTLEYQASKHVFSKTGTNPTGGVSAPTFQVEGLNNEFIAFGAGGQALYLTAAAGTPSSPTAVTASNPSRIFASLYTGSAYAINGGLSFTPTETHSGSVQGTKFDLSTTKTGTTSLITSFTVDGAADVRAVAGNLTIDTAGKGLVVKSGANTKLDATGALTAGSKVVSNTSVTANSRIFFTLKTLGGTVGIAPYVSAVSAGTSFTVTATATDTSDYYYFIVESQ